MLERKEYYFLTKEDVKNLHGGSFEGQLPFYKVLCANSCYGLYKLKCLIVQFSLLKI